jgi:hypothetical protein
MRSGIGKRDEIILGAQFDIISCKYCVLHYTIEGVYCKGYTQMCKCCISGEELPNREVLSLGAPSRSDGINFGRK